MGFLGADDAGTPDIAKLEEHFGDFAGVVKSWHPGGAQQWQALVQQTAQMVLDYAGLTPDDLMGMVDPALVLAVKVDDERRVDSRALGLVEAHREPARRLGHGEVRDLGHRLGDGHHRGEGGLEEHPGPGNAYLRDAVGLHLLEQRVRLRGVAPYRTPSTIPFYSRPDYPGLRVRR